VAYRFEIRHEFPKANIADLASRSKLFEKDDTLIDIGRRSRETGKFTREDFIIVCESAQASMRLCLANSPENIARATQITLSSNSDRQRISSLMRLSGVSWFSASWFLHLVFEDEYPILSRNGLWSSGFESKRELTFEIWWEYVQGCRSLAAERRVSLRTVSRALAQFAIEQHEPTASRRKHVIRPSTGIVS
jgi:hypothetical protein